MLFHWILEGSGTCSYVWILEASGSHVGIMEATGSPRVIQIHEAGTSQYSSCMCGDATSWIHMYMPRAHDKTGEEEERVTSADSYTGKITRQT